jgi:flagellar hook assembly protein FlgD
MSAPGVRPATGPVGPTLPKLRISTAVAKPAVVQGATTQLRYRLTTSATVTARLLDASGNLISTLFTAVQRAGKRSVTVGASPLDDGRYRIALSAASADGQQATASLPLTVDRTLGGFTASATAFSPRRSQTVSFLLMLNTRPAHVRLRIERGKSVVATVADADEVPGSQTIVWNGRNRGGKLVRPGSYRAVLRVSSAIATATRSLPLRIR